MRGILGVTTHFSKKSKKIDVVATRFQGGNQLHTGKHGFFGVLKSPPVYALFFGKFAIFKKNHCISACATSISCFIGFPDGPAAQNEHFTVEYIVFFFFQKSSTDKRLVSRMSIKTSVGSRKYRKNRVQKSVFFLHFCTPILRSVL